MMNWLSFGIEGWVTRDDVRLALGILGALCEQLVVRQIHLREDVVSLGCSFCLSLGLRL
ncbi:hypothetical protein HanXRQr2_Chr03g0089381 [Helianthus annuus]|uniref:Uncharacterized protein n=1 Tax=Helianthus annuus TaxID=4232 RepID=A0A9K3NTL4_HELAN|nr:hypothetical protein HanXRQr2_Chr03g0089381 [Helianthus annuus]